MNVTELPIGSIAAPDWNPNEMDGAMGSRLKASIQRFGLVVPLVVRSAGSGYETVGGAQRLAALRDMGSTYVPCVVVDTDDVEARLLSQCLNQIAGDDDLGLKSELLRKVLGSVTQEQVLSLLPETSESLQALCSMGQDTIAAYLENWRRAQAARLHHLQFQITPGQLEVIEEALVRLMAAARESMDGSPNVKGTALYLMARAYLETAKEGS